MTPEDTPNPSPPASPGEPVPPPEASGTAVFHRDTSGDVPRPAAGSGAARALVGKSLGKYQVTGTLGEGGMGIVLKAHDPMIERDVAIKLLADHLAADATALG